MRHIRLIPVVGVCLGSMLTTNFAMAAFPEEQEGIRVVAGAGLVHDSNVFLLPSSLNPPNSTEKSDQIRNVYAGLLVDKTVELQRFKLSARIDHASYNRFSFLDYDAKSLTGVWQWAAAGGRWKGDLGYEHAESLNSFLDYRPGTSEVAKNLRTDKTVYFNAGYGLLSDWLARFNLTDRKSTNELPIRADSDIEVKSVAAGARYQPIPENFVEWLARHGHGSYFNASVSPLVDNTFDDNELEMNGQWTLTGKSKIIGLVKYVDWSYPTATVRDFSGWAGRIEHSWSITGKTSLRTTLARDLYPYIDSISGASFVTADRLSLAPEWKATEKITLRATLSRMVRDFRGQLAEGLPRNDALNLAGLTIEYLPIRTARLSASFQRQERSGNFSEFDYSDRLISLNADVAF